MNTKIVEQVEHDQLKTDLPDFRVGDSVRLGLKVVDTKEGERIQFFEGVLIRVSGSGLRKTITVRKIGVNNVGVERIIPVHAPLVDSVTIVRQGSSRKSRMYYLRDRVGKAALAVKEKKRK